MYCSSMGLWIRKSIHFVKSFISTNITGGFIAISYSYLSQIILFYANSNNTTYYEMVFFTLQVINLLSIKKCSKRWTVRLHLKYNNKTCFRYLRNFFSFFEPKSVWQKGELISLQEIPLTWESVVALYCIFMNIFLVFVPFP